MDIVLKPKLIEVYKRYGFHLARDQAKDGFLVFTLKTGYFDNAEIVKLSPLAQTESIFQELTNSGYACTTRDATSPEQAEEELFRGFFSVDSTRDRLRDDYLRFSASLVAPYGIGAKYSYIKAPYQINGREGTLSPPEEVLNRMHDVEPTLFLIEAAAGFGKTCTALEIVNLLAQHQTHLPLYAELSKNRQARIFRYILLDEIDRTFPLLSSNLVQTEIRNGRVAAILDGFDELLRKNEETGEFENKEPMLETVSELLTGKAKVIITTRRTVLFDGDEFHQWLDRHAESFKIIRIRIQEPRVVDWLSQDRLSKLEDAGLRMDAMANPVLLSYLKCINDTTFHEATLQPEKIVESYFGYMLERERERQDLRMSVLSQGLILQSIAFDMMSAGYTAEQRDYIVNFILTKQSKIIDETRSQYSAADKPSREEIANKLASHALLDRSSQDPNKIGFINEFALGNYVAANILETEAWLGDDLRFIDPAVRSYKPRSSVSRLKLYDSLGESLPYLDASSRIEISSELCNQLPSDLMNDEAEGLSLDGLHIGTKPITNFQFNDCMFRKCVFHRSNLNGVFFLNCRFYECEVQIEHPAGPIFVLGGSGVPDISLVLANTGAIQEDMNGEDPTIEVERIILKKFWPIGESTGQKPSRPIFKPLKFLCRASGSFSSADFFHGFEKLRKRGLLIEMNKSGLISLNSDTISDAQAVLASGQ